MGILLCSTAILLSADETKAPPSEEPVQFFRRDEVQLLPGPFAHAQQLVLAYVLAHDVDRLLAPFRLEAGLPSPAEKYPNWESMGLDGHTAGHYLTALAQLAANTGDAECQRRLDKTVAGLAECQAAGGDGYVGGIPRGRTLWNDIAAGRIDFQNFSLNGAWVPWYNEHKLFAGLRDAWLIGGNAQARDVLVRLADWCDRLLQPLSDAQMQAMLGSEHGGMNEVLADVYTITGEPKYLRLAQRFSHRAILEPLLAHEDRLTGLHANTQIPKVIGFARIAELGGDPAWAGAARFFWDTVVDRRSLVFGGNSEREHFNPTEDFGSLVESREGPETCNTFNMLRLTEALFRHAPDAEKARKVDYYERALYNHILSSQHPEHGGFVYFTPIRPRHYRTYSKAEVSFWCCVGTGMENHGKYNAFIYAFAPDALYVNLFVASQLDWRERGLRVRQETTFPDEPRTRLVISTDQPQRLALRLRHPGWAGQGGVTVTVNGKPELTSTKPASYLTLEREWREGDTVEMTFAMRTTVEPLPDGSPYVAVLHGPIVLAASTGKEQLDGLVQEQPTRFGHISQGPYLPLDQAPMLVGDRTSLLRAITPVPGKTLTFSAQSAIQPASFQDLELIPFFRLHDARYVMYWRNVSAQEYPSVVAQLEASEHARLQLERRTLDQVAPGEQQPEVDHGFRSEGSATGVNQGRRWRDAAGWFEYELDRKGKREAVLIVTYYGDERGRRFDVVVNDHPLASVAREGGTRDRFVDVSYPLPASLLAEPGPLRVKFVAKPPARTAAIYGIRLVTADPQQ